MKIIIILLGFIVSVGSMAQVNVEGRLYSSQDCNYYYSTLGDFNLSYESSNLKVIKSVQFIVGFHNTWGAKDWASVQNVPATKVSNTHWVSNLVGVSVSERGSFAFDAVEWIVQIENMDGSKIWSRPTDINSFYIAQFPTDLPCARGEFHPLLVKTNKNL